MIIGKGSHQYEVVEGWAQLPEGIEFGYTHGVVTDSQDRVYVHNQSKDAIIVFDKEGRFLNSWGEEFAEGAHGLLLNKEGDQEFLYLTDIKRGIVVKTTLDGKVLLTLGKPDLPEVYDEDKKYMPTDVAVAPNGDIYVADGYGRAWIHQYDKEGNRIRSWGGGGSEPGEMKCPHGISVDTRSPEPLIYVADRGNQRIQIFNLDGELVRIVNDDINMVCNFFQFENELYFPDLHSKVTILDKEDKLITHLGEHDAYTLKGRWPNLPKEELITGKFNSPHALCVDSSGDIYLVEWIVYGRLTKLIRK